METVVRLVLQLRGAWPLQEAALHAAAGVMQQAAVHAIGSFYPPAPTSHERGTARSRSWRSRP